MLLHIGRNELTHRHDALAATTGVIECLANQFAAHALALQARIDLRVGEDLTVALVLLTGDAQFLAVDFKDVALLGLVVSYDRVVVVHGMDSPVGLVDLAACRSQ